ncbi:MAG: uroporphyrinogen-III synthase [Methanomassiliicoccales archaeon PtaU1.Bin124]|nr:MAG: uroporphyrinogen-III synthase [Methanomassiliicoccales archaeon PtaU1.Bin124]
MTTVAILRTKDKKEESVRMAEEMGLTVRFASPLELAEKDSTKFWQFVEEVESGKAKQVVLTSSTAVKYMLNLLQKKEKAGAVVKKLNEKGIIAIGPLTAETARKEWIKATAIPEKFNIEGLVVHLKGRITAGEKVWVLRSDKTMDVLVKGLEASGAKVEEVAVYSLRRSEPDRALLDVYYWTVHGGIDAYVFTSAMTAEVFIEDGEKKYGVRQFGQALNSSVIAAIGEPTKNTLERLGIDVDVMPDDATFEKTMQALQKFIHRDQN